MLETTYGQLSGRALKQEYKAGKFLVSLHVLLWPRGILSVTIGRKRIQTNKVNSHLSALMKLPEVILVPLQPEDREQFILDNQWAFKYGAQQEFGMRDERCEEGEEVISRKTIENSIGGENAETYRIVLDGQKVGGVVLQIDKEAAKGELELLFVLPECHSKGIGQAAWKAVEALHPEIKVWETITPYFEKRNIHFYVNRCGFHIVEFWNKHHHGPAVPEEMEENWNMDDEMFVFRKEMTARLLPL